MRHQRDLRILLQGGLSDKEEDSVPFSGVMSGVIPEELLTPELKKLNHTSMVLSGKDREQFYSVFDKLREDRATEYLSDKEIKDRLWFLLCDVFINRSVYKDGSKLKNKIDEFLSDLCKPEIEHEVMFKVLNFDVGLKQLQFWDCLITKYDRQALIDWGFDPSRRHIREVKDFEDQTQIIVKERGNNPGLIIKRAREKAKRRLKALQVYLSERNYLYDEQLLFELAEDAAVRKLDSPSGVLSSWTRKRSPWGLEYYDAFEKHVTDANHQLSLFETFNPKIKAIIERAIFWIGKAIEEAEPDLKVIALCSAMETILTTKSDKRKGEAIAYRMVLLEAHFEDKISHPGEVLWIYKLRSSVVHGSSIDEATKFEYYTMRGAARQTLKNFINFVSQKGIKKQTAFIEALESSTHAKTLADWLSHFDDDESLEIRKALLNALGDVDDHSNVSY